MKKKILVLMLASMLAASCVACGSKSSDKKDELSSAATEMLSETETETEQIEEQDITADALTPLSDAGVITGVQDTTVEEGTEKAIANGDTNVVTPETKESVAESNKAKANDNAVASKPAKKSDGNTGNSNAGKNNSNGNSNNSNSGNAGNNGNGNSGNNGNHNGNNGGNNGNHNGNTEKPHVHKYNSGVVTAKPDCTHTGIKTYTCVDGDDSYEETIPALGHDYVQRTETVTTKEAWDEDVYEGFYVCCGCGAKFEETIDFYHHSVFARRENPNTKCKNYYTDEVKVNTIHHPAETETRTYKVCSRCGDTVK